MTRTTIKDHTWSKEDVQAIKAVWNGQASADTQRRVIRHLVEVLCGINSIPLVPGEPDLTAFNVGRAWVGRQLQNAITIPLDQLTAAKDTHDDVTGDTRVPTATERHAAVRSGRTSPRGR